MSETMREYVLGDSVISRCALVAPPVERPGVRLEIPPACRGVVVDVRQYEYPYPYVVAFEVADGATVEIDVKQDQVVRVARPAGAASVCPAQDMPPLVTVVPDRYIKQDGEHEITYSCPHRRCRGRHAVNMLLMLAALGMYAGSEAPYALPVVLVLVVLAYIYHLCTGGAWNRLPEPVRPTEAQELVINPRWARYAALSDRVFTVTLIVLLLCYNPNFVNSSNAETVPYVAAGLAFIAWAAKFAVHGKAARIYYVS